jgi:hypothetical protein
VTKYITIIMSHSLVVWTKDLERERERECVRARSRGISRVALVGILMFHMLVLRAWEISSIVLYVVGDTQVCTGTLPSRFPLW